MTSLRPIADYFLFDPRRASGRAIVATALGVATAALAPLSLPMRILLGWNAFALTLCATGWVLIFRSDARQTAHRAGAEDPGRTLVAIVTLLSSLVSVFAAVALSRDQTQAPALGAIGLAWLLTHTTYSFRYAHLYYRDDGEGVGGLNFPGEARPDDFDFAYFAFTVGMCFQVSDVAVTSPLIRRSVLMHAMISYIYSAVILATTLNLIVARMA